MRCKTLIVLLAIILFFSIGLANANACIELKTSKAVYFPGETAQVEIDARVTRTISSNDVFFYRGTTRLPLAIFFSKVTDTKYFAWFDLPNKPGLYTIKARGYCPQLHTEELSIEIQDTIASRHVDFKNKVENKWRTLSLETHILAAGALSYDEIAQQGFSEYVKRIDSCVNSKCSTKEAALTLMSFDNLLLRQQMYDMLSLYQNYFSVGEFQLQISSAVAQKCNVTAGNITTELDIVNGINFFNVTDALSQLKLEKTLSLEINCENDFNATLDYLYNDFEKNFKLTKINNKLSANIDNSGCWGTEFKGSCDAKATSYVLLALALTRSLDYNNTAHSYALAWLKKNAASIEEKAILYYITRDPELLSWLLAVQDPSGYWPAEAFEPSIRTTALTLFVLKNREAEAEEAVDKISRAEIWLKSQELTFSDESFVLFFTFPSAEIEPVLSIWPGFVKTESKSSFNLVLTNKGTKDMKVNATLFKFSKIISLEKDSIKNVHFDVPTVMTLDGRSILSTLALDYNSMANSAASPKHYFYSIPLLIFSEKGDQEYIGEPSATEQEINQTDQEAIKNKTNPLENKTTELNISLIEEKFVFIEENLTLEVNRTVEPFTKEITLGNALDKNISDIELSASIALQQFGFVEIDPTTIENIGPGEKVKIELKIDPSAVMAQTYKGYVQASAKYEVMGITTNIPLEITISAGPAELFNCTERGGVYCDPDTMECENPLKTTIETSYCCIPAEACKKKAPAGRNIGLAVVAIIIAVLLILLLILRRKPKKAMKAFLEERVKKYEEEKRLKRPPSMRKPIMPGWPGATAPGTTRKRPLM